MLPFLACIAAATAGQVEIYRAWPNTGGPSYAWRGSAADWQRMWQNDTNTYQRSFPIFETANELHLQSSRAAFAGTSDPDIGRANMLFGMRPNDLQQNCSNCETANRLQYVLSEIGKFTVTMDILMYTQNGWQDFALGLRTYFLSAIKPNTFQEIAAAGVGYATGIRTAFLDLAWECDKVTTQAFVTDTNSTCYRLDCDTQPACGIPCEIRKMNSTYVPITAGSLETPWLNVTYEIDANLSMVAVTVWNGTDYIVPRQVAYLPQGIDTGLDLAIGLGNFVGSMRIRNFIITTDAIGQPDTPSPTSSPTPSPTLVPSPAPTPVPSLAPTPVPSTVPLFVPAETSTIARTPNPPPVPAAHATTASSASFIFLYTVPVALVVLGICVFAAYRILRRKRAKRASAQYMLTDMAIEPPFPSRPPPRIVQRQSSPYGSALVQSPVSSDYVAPMPEQPAYAQLSISAGTGYEPNPLANAVAYGITSLADEQEHPPQKEDWRKTRRKSRQL